MALKLLLKEIRDRYIQENFKRIQKEIESLDSTVAGTVNNVVNIVATQVWEKFDDVVSASSTKSIDTFKFTDLLKRNYEITVYNSVENKFKTFTMTVSKRNGDVSDTVYNKDGDVIDYGINAVIVGPNVELQVQNNETYNLDVSFGRLTL